MAPAAFNVVKDMELVARFSFSTPALASIIGAMEIAATILFWATASCAIQIASALLSS
jgi:hypothetical protein